MMRIELNGDWELSQLSEDNQLCVPATVPGCVHTDLIEAGKIEDPYYRDNELSLQWIGESVWQYSRVFKLEDFAFDPSEAWLVCEGLDTLADVYINDQLVGASDNMFRTWEWSIGRFLQAGENSIRIVFHSAVAYGQQKQKDHYLVHTGIGHHRIEGGNWVRKEACNFGWDWGPMLVTAGIWRPIFVEFRSSPRIFEIHHEATVSENGTGELSVHTAIEWNGDFPNAELEVILEDGGNKVGQVSVPLMEGGSYDARIDVDEVKKWWPTGMGDQSLYQLTVRLIGESSFEIDRKQLNIGFRTLELVTEFDEWGQSFKFRANGVDFFAKGANWVPADTFDNRVSDDDLRDLLQSAVDANMNCIRVWGGAIYERDAFYDYCDELGICVWQDFMFACSAYPLHESDFIENITLEAEAAVKRIRHHASLALWCGNNELEHMDGYIGDAPGAMKWGDYSKWFDVKLREIVNRLNPATCYWPASEHSPIGNRTPRSHSSDPRWGDAHLWRVWHGREPFEWYRGSLHRFCSEFGFQSFPHPRTIETFTNQDDRSITGRIMELHQRSEDGNANIMHYMMDWFRLPTSFENGIWLSQILQCMGIKYAVEHWRRNMPRCMGATYWQLNDCWPVASWSSLDSQHRWKALHYDAKRFFARKLISVIEHPEDRSLEVYVTNDDLQTCAAQAVVRAWNLVSAEVLHETFFEFELPSNGASKVATYEANESVKNASEYDLVFEISLWVDGQIVSSNTATMVRPKHLNLQDPELSFSVNSGELWIECKKPALWVWFDDVQYPDARFSDSFFALFPGQRKRIEESSGDVRSSSLACYSLRDTYS